MNRQRIKTRNFIVIISYIFLVSFNQTEENNILDYFINPELGKVNYRNFESFNSISPKIIFKQTLTEVEGSENEILMEYVFMNQDSIPHYGGIERLKNNSIEIVEQSVYLEDRKIFVKIIEGKFWDLKKEPEKYFSSVVIDDKTGLKIIGESQAFSRFKDTLGQKCFIVELKSNSRTFFNGAETQKTKALSKRIYVKNKGLVYTGQTTDGVPSDYYLTEE